MIAAPSRETLALAHGSTPPGEWRDIEAVGEQWEGTTDWITEHGPSQVLWSYGRPTTAWNVELPDGRFASAEVVAIDCWRLWVDGVSMLGEVTISEGRCTALVHEKEQYSPPSEGLEADLWSSRDFRAMLRKTSFIGATHAYLSCNAFRMDMTDIGRFRMSSQEASVMLSRMRGWGTARLDTRHAWFSFPPYHTVVFEEILEDIGWHALTPEEYAVDHARALQLLDRIETRRKGFVADQDRPNIFQLQSFSRKEGAFSPAMRMLSAIREGRCEQADLDVFFKLIDHHDQRIGADLEYISDF